MTRVCTVCSHPDRKEIDRAILAGEPNRRIAAQWSLSETAVRRHKKDHIPKKVAKATEAREVVQADNLLDQVRALLSTAQSLTQRAESSGDLRTALAGVREIRGTLELMAKIMGDLPAGGPMVGILISPEWTAARSAILRALEPYPDAKIAVVEELGKIPQPSTPEGITVTGTPMMTRIVTPEAAGPVRLSDIIREGK